MLTYNRLVNGREAHPIVLDVALLQIFGPDWIAWDADSTFMAIERSLGTSASKQTKAKIRALGVLHSNRSYWEDWRAFEAVNWALSGKQVDLVELNPLHALPLLYGMRVARWIDRKSTFSQEVISYAICVFLHDQFSLLPKDLATWQSKLLDKRPDLSERSELVKSAILSKNTSYFDENSEDPVKVEVSKHRVLDVLLNSIGSAEFVIMQARQYGLGSLVESVIEGGIQ